MYEETIYFKPEPFDNEYVMSQLEEVLEEVDAKLTSKEELSSIIFDSKVRERHDGDKHYYAFGDDGEITITSYVEEKTTNEYASVPLTYGIEATVESSNHDQFNSVVKKLVSTGDEYGTTFQMYAKENAQELETSDDTDSSLFPMRTGKYKGKLAFFPNSGGILLW